MPNDTSAPKTTASTVLNDQTTPADPTSPAQSTVTPVPLEDSLKAYEILRPAINAFPNARAASINTDVGSVAQSALWAVRQLKTIEGDIRREASTYDVSNIQQLYTAALALNYLHARHRLLKNATRTEEAQWLLERRDELRLDVQFLIRHKVVSPDRVSKLELTNGHHALAYDVIGLADILLEKVDHLPSQFWTRAELEASRRKADDFFNVLGDKQYGPGADAEIKVARRKVFAMLVALWNDLYAVVQYVRRGEGDVDRLMPALYPARPGRRPSGTTQVPPTTVANGRGNALATPGDDDEDTDADDNADEVDGPLDLSAINAAATRATNAVAVEGVVPAGFPGARPLRPIETT
jgi:hypothetical protein